MSAVTTICMCNEADVLSAILLHRRLTFSLDFAKAMGYSYHLQFDDDAMLNSALAYNVVDKLKERNYLMVRELVASIDYHVLRASTVTWCRITTRHPPTCCTVGSVQRPHRGSTASHPRPPRAHSVLVEHHPVQAEGTSSKEPPPPELGWPD